MKKLSLIVLFAISGILNSIEAQEINYGLKAGLNMSNLSGVQDDTNNLISFHAGIFAKINFSEKFAFQPELLYSKQGTENQEVDAKVKLDYLTMPIMVKYYLGDKFSLEAGPQMSFLLNDKAVFNNSDLPDFETDAESFDFGFNIGLGLDLTKNLVTQLRYNFGITTVVENPDVKTSVLQVSLGYKF